MPQRIQRRRAKGWTTPLCSCGCGNKAIYVGRGSRWGNPYCVVAIRPHGPFDVVRRGGIFVAQATGIDLARQIAAERYEHAVIQRWPGYPTFREIHTDLRGHDLMCWCPGNAPCHADVLLNLAKGGTS